MLFGVVKTEESVQSIPRLRSCHLKLLAFVAISIIVRRFLEFSPAETHKLLVCKSDRTLADGL